MKKIFIISIIFLLLTTLIFGGFFFFQNRNKSTPEQQNDNFFPLGNIMEFFGGTSTNVDIQTNDINNFSQNTYITPTQTKISDDPIGGFDLISTNDQDFIFYTDKTSGHIYYKSNLSDSPRRISNTTIPEINDLKVGINSGQLNIIISTANKSFYSNIQISNLIASSTEELNIPLTESRHLEISLNPDKNRGFMLEKLNDGSLGMIKNINLTGGQQIFNSPIANWVAQWASRNIIALVQKPSGKLSSNLYFLNTESGNLEKIIESKKGLQILVSPDSNFIIYSQVEGDAFSTYLLNRESRQVTHLKIKALPEKCVWATDSTVVYCAVSEEFLTGLYPDDWYKGLVSFSDDIWFIDTVDGKEYKVYDTGNLSPDITKLQLLDHNTLVFMNKLDDTLWRIDLID